MSQGKKHHPHHVRTHTGAGIRKLLFVPALAAVALFTFSYILDTPSPPLVSSELRFADASPSGLAILPASCNSAPGGTFGGGPTVDYPHYPGECDPPPANCTFNGQTVTHGSSVTAYQASTVPYGQSCTSQSRTCTNGSLSGSYAYSGCSVGAAANCSFNGATVYHGSGVTAYASPSVPYGSSCSSQWRSCTNGSLSGSYGYGSCTVGPPPAPTCSVWADQNPISYGSGTTLRWSSTNATSFYINSVGYVGGSGATWVAPLSSTNYGGSVSGAGGSATCPYTLSVGVPPLPTCSEAHPQSATTDATSGNFVAYATGVANATAMYFPTWSDPGGQDDLVWYPGTNDGGGNWHANINLASHQGLGPMYVHVYMTSASYGLTWCDEANFTRAAPDISCGAPGTNAFTGCYYDNQNFTSPKVFRTDPSINFNWGGGSPDATKIGPDTFSVRWEGNFTLSAGDYRFTTVSDDGVRVWVDGTFMVDNWTDHGPTTNWGDKTLTAGTHAIKMEFYENGGGAVAALSWVAACIPSYSCSGQTIRYTNAQCQISNITTCISPAFCSPGSAVCLYPPMEFVSFVDHTGHLEVRPLLVRAGDTARVFWNVDNAESCTVTENIAAINDTWTDTSSGDTGRETSALEEATTYTLHCTALPNASPPEILETRTVLIVPSFEEI